MSAKHTPGPWSWDSDFEGLRAGNGEDVLSFAPLEGMWLTYSHSAKANARLIAAAPDLLDALRALVAVDDAARADGSNGYVKGSPHDRKWRAARAAIAKAEGAV